MRRRPASRWRRLRRRRRITVAGLLLLAAFSGLFELRGMTGSGAGTVEVAVAARDVASGAVLQPADLAVGRVPSDSLLAGVGLASETVMGRTTVGDLAEGEMVTSTRLLDAAGAAPGFASVPVRFDDAHLAAYLAPGMRVAVVWTPDGLGTSGSEVLAEDARVLRLGEASGTLAETRATALLEVHRDEAVRLAGAQQTGSLSVLLR